MRIWCLGFALTLSACGSSSDDEVLHDLPVENDTSSAPRTTTDLSAREALSEDPRAFETRESRPGATLLEGGFYEITNSGGAPARLVVGVAQADASAVRAHILLDPHDGRRIAEGEALGVWIPRAHVLVPSDVPDDGVFAMRRTSDGERFDVTLRLPDGEAPRDARVSPHPDADRVWFRAQDAQGVTHVGALETLETQALVLAHALPGPPGLARFDSDEHRFEAVFPGGPGECAYAAFGEATCRRRGAWRGAGRMSEIPLGDGWLLVEREGGHGVAQTLAEGQPELTALHEGCPGYSLIGALGDPPRVAYQCMGASPPSVRVWSPNERLEVPYPAGQSAARFTILDLRIPALMGPGFEMATPRATWLDLTRMRAFEGPPLLAVDDMLGPGMRFVAVHPGERSPIRVAMIDLDAGTVSEVGPIACEGTLAFASRGGHRVALRCVVTDAERFSARTVSSVILDTESRTRWTTTHRVEAILPDGLVIASDRRRDGGERAHRLFALELD